MRKRHDERPLPKGGIFTAIQATRFIRILPSAMLLTIMASTAKPVAAQESGMSWKDDWTRVQTWELVVAGTLAATSFSIKLLAPPPEEANWTGGVLFDDEWHDFVTLSESDSRLQAAHISDGFWYGLMVYPFVVDTLIMTLAVHREPDVALQMALINAEAFAFTSVLNALMIPVVRRERPLGAGCAAQDDYDPVCGSSAQYRSFLSGHTALAFTGAGLMCAHHANLPIYGEDVPDYLVCGLGMTAAAVTGTLRMVSERHWISDVLVSAGIGIFSGYVLPNLLHYHWGRGDITVDPAPRVTAMPFGGRDRLGIALIISM